jgi:hypothetical protein
MRWVARKPSPRIVGNKVAEAEWRYAIKKTVLNMLRLDTTGKPQTSLRQMRKIAAWDDDIRASILGIKPI